MRKPPDQLINALVSDLAPTARRPALNPMAFTWLACSLVYVVLVTLMLGAYRPGFTGQLLAHPRFAGEMLLGLAAITAVALALFRSAVPGALGRHLHWLAIGLVCLWLGSQLASLVSPALPPAMLGKRPHCLYETLLIALPPLGIALLLQRRLYPLRPARSAGLAGLCAGMMPAWIMQVACMYDPQHSLAFHMLPGLSVAVVAMLVGLVVLQPRP
ncbi:MAG: DUF1109 domain-containing protein [Gammaproteobacteria bacterium]|nr:DUF1109 domain-containing protein [Gammaproteobacteria bacterium]